MRNKIVGIIVCMLVLATAIPAVTSMKQTTTDAVVPSHAQASILGNWVESQKLHASDGSANTRFGTAISVDGDTAVVGAVVGTGVTAGSGAAYVFVRSGTTWTEQQKLYAPDGAFNDQFGCFVSVSGDTALIGAGWDDDNGADSGSAYIFTRTGTAWSLQQKLTAPDGTPNDWFGLCVSLAGDTALIGAQGDYGAGDLGAAYVFIRTGTTWSLQQELFASDGAPGDCFGYTVWLEGDTALIGADLDDDNGADSGSAYIFTRTGTTWNQQAKLLATDGAAGDDFSGGGVALSGDTALIAAEMDDDNGADSGSAYIFTRTGTTWTQQTKLLAADGAAGDQFGMYGLALYADTAMIGAWDDDDMGTNSGSAYVFTRTGTTWTQEQKLLASDGYATDQFGVAIALVADTALIGSWADDDTGANSGSVYVFTKQNQPPAEVPVWEKGDSWTYNEQYLNHVYKEDGTLALLWYHNCTSTYTVTDTTGDNYTVTMTSTDNEGSLLSGWLRLKYTRFTKLSGEVVLRKTDLAYVRDSFTEKGFVILKVGKLGLPLPAQFSDTWGARYTPAGIVFPFPLIAGDSGVIPNASYVGHEKSSLYWGLLKLVDSDYSGYFGEQNYTCAMANLTVPAGTYTAYNASMESPPHSTQWSYYAPEAGWFVKQDIYSEDENGNPTYLFTCELVSTTYTP